MKRTLLLALLMMSFSAMAQRKIALIVAVGEYPVNSGWSNLSSMNDIKYVKAGLMKHGFADGDISLLLNQQATKAGILKALDELYNRAQLNDVIVFHFSGHGQQIFDDNGDEKDGYDEALIPYDAAARYDPVTYKGENHLRDDELGAKLNRIREKIGRNGSLIVLVDACHSGTSTRGPSFPMRGTPIPFSKPGYKPNIKTTLGAEESFLGNGSPNGIGNFVVISASNPHQVNYETRDADNAGVGSLSFAFAKAITDLQTETNYSTLYSKIKAIIQAQFPQQVPMIEGDVKLRVFGGNIIPQQSYLGVERWVNDTTIMVNTGFINNVARDAKFTIYALNDKDETMPLAEGIITIAGSFQSFGTLNKKLPKGEVYKVKIDETGFGDFKAAVNFQSAKGVTRTDLVNQIRDYIKPFEYLQVGTNADYLFDIQESRNGGSIVQLIDKSDSTRWGITLKKDEKISEEALKQMLSNLKKAMRINYLRNMADGGNLVQNVIVEVTPMANPVANATDLWMKEGDKFKIRIVNNNPYKLYFNLVDITPDNGVKVLIPTGDVGNEEDYVIQPNAELVIDDVTVDPGTPSGREFMKFIFTKTAMDLRPVLARNGTRGPKNNSGMDDVFNDMFKDGESAYSTRSSMPSKTKIDEVGIITRSFSIKK